MEHSIGPEESTPAPKDQWQSPELTAHGDFEDLTRFTAGAGPDDGLFDPGVGDSAV
jgi:hypothetical protein